MTASPRRTVTAREKVRLPSMVSGMETGNASETETASMSDDRRHRRICRLDRIRPILPSLFRLASLLPITHRLHRSHGTHKFLLLDRPLVFPCRRRRTPSVCSR